MNIVSQRRVAASAAVALLVAAAHASAQDHVRADQLFETAMSAFKLERYEDAATKFYDFMAAAPHDPRNDQSQYLVGRCFMHRNYLNRALEELGYAIEDFPASPYATLALHDRAQCYLKTRDTGKAVGDMEELISRKVEIYRGSDDPLKRQLHDNHRNTAFWLGKHYLDAGEHEKAIGAYQRLPHPIEAFRYVVDVYYGLGNFDKIRELIDGLQEENRHEGFKFLIEFYGKKKAINQLKDIFARLLREENPTRATDDLVWTTADSFKHIGAEQWNWAMQQVSAYYPRLSRKADMELARRHWEEPSYLDDLELFVVKYRSGQDVDEVIRWKGITLERTGRAEEARENYRRMGDAALGHWYAAETYHGGYAKAKNLPAAIAEYVQLRTAFYSVEWAAMAQWRVAELYRSLKNVDKAVESFRHIVKRFAAIDIREGHYANMQRRLMNVHHRAYGPAAQLALANVLREAKQYDDAEMEYRVVIRQYPRSEEAPMAAYRVALCYEGRDDPDTAVKVLKSVLRRYPKTSSASEAHTRLETRYKIADTEVADDLDIFADDNVGTDGKSYIEDPTLLKR